MNKRLNADKRMQILCKLACGMHTHYIGQESLNSPIEIDEIDSVDDIGMSGLGEIE